MHGATDHEPLIVLLTVFMADRYLDKLCGHANESRGPHPKQRSGPAQKNSECHAANVACTNGSRQRCRQGLEVTGVTWVLFFGVTPK